jgi:hypothetical protein
MPDINLLMLAATVAVIAALLYGGTWIQRLRWARLEKAAERRGYDRCLEETTRERALPPAELDPSRFDHTLPAIPPVTEPIPPVAEGPVTGDLGAATPEPRPMLAIGAPDPEPSVVLTVSHLPPDGDGTTVHGRRYTLAEHEPMPDGNTGVARTHRALTAEAARTRGKVLITISSRRGYTRIDTPASGEWPTEPVAAAIQHHRGHTPAAATPVRALHAVTVDPSEAWAGRW